MIQRPDLRRQPQCRASRAAEVLHISARALDRLPLLSLCHLRSLDIPQLLEFCDSLLKSDSWFPPQKQLGLFYVCLRVMCFYSWRAINDFPTDEIGKGFDSDIPSCANIYHLAFPHFGAICCEEIRSHDVAHMRVVSRHSSIAIDCYWFVILSGHQKRPDCEWV